MMQAHTATRMFGIEEILRHRGLLLALVIREVQARYRGTMLGISWSVIYPLLMLGVYTFVFGVIFNSRWSSAGRRRSSSSRCTRRASSGASSASTATT